MWFPDQASTPLSMEMSGDCFHLRDSVASLCVSINEQSAASKPMGAAFCSKFDAVITTLRKPQIGKRFAGGADRATGANCGRNRGDCEDDPTVRSF